MLILHLTMIQAQIKDLKKYYPLFILKWGFLIKYITETKRFYYFANVATTKNRLNINPKSTESLYKF